MVILSLVLICRYVNRTKPWSITLILYFRLRVNRTDTRPFEEEQAKTISSGLGESLFSKWCYHRECRNYNLLFRIYMQLTEFWSFIFLLLFCMFLFWKDLHFSLTTFGWPKVLCSHQSSFEICLFIFLPLIHFVHIKLSQRYENGILYPHLEA